MPAVLGRTGAVATVTLDRPDKLNALSPDMPVDLVRIFDDLRVDDAVRTIGLTGTGRGYCSDADIGVMRFRDVRGARSLLQTSAHPFVTAIFDREKPVVAAVNGPAVGIGGSLALGALVQPQLNQTAHHAEGVAAFEAKRPPRFQGR